MTQLHNNRFLSCRKLSVLCHIRKYQNDTSLHITFKRYAYWTDIMKTRETALHDNTLICS